MQTRISVQGGNFNNLEWSLEAKGTLIVVKSTESSLKTENLSKNVGKLDFANDILTFLINYRLRSFFFEYNCNKGPEHYINNINLIDNINILPDILMRLFNSEIDLSINNQKAVECNIFIERLIDFSNKS